MHQNQTGSATIAQPQVSPEARAVLDAVNAFIDKYDGECNVIVSLLGFRGDDISLVEDRFFYYPEDVSLAESHIEGLLNDEMFKPQS